jgi:hypothetical protein
LFESHGNRALGSMGNGCGRKGESGMRKFIKIGTKVDTRWGEAKVTGIELCQNGEKYGIDMPKIFLEDKDRCTFDLDNGHWAYGYQVEPVNA